MKQSSFYKVSNNFSLCSCGSVTRFIVSFMFCAHTRRHATLLQFLHAFQQNTKNTHFQSTRWPRSGTSRSFQQLQALFRQHRWHRTPPVAQFSEFSIQFTYISPLAPGRHGEKHGTYIGPMNITCSQHCSASRLETSHFQSQVPPRSQGVYYKSKQTPWWLSLKSPFFI